MKREIPILLTVICGLLITWAFFSPSDISQGVNVELSNWATIFFSVAFLLGIGNLFRINLKHISGRDRDWQYKALLLLVLVTYLTIGIGEIHGWWGNAAGDNSRRLWVYRSVFQPLQSTMFSLLAFYIASAAFRAFRARSVEATLLLTAGALVMLGQVPMPDWIPYYADISSGSARIQAFLMQYVNGAGQKAIIMGAALGTLATGLRIVLGIERSYLSE